MFSLFDIHIWTGLHLCRPFPTVDVRLTAFSDELVVSFSFSVVWYLEYNGIIYLSLSTFPRLLKLGKSVEKC